MADIVANCELRNSAGKTVKGSEVLATKITGLYFSAHWCIWCRRFTPILKNFYEQLLDNEEFEIIFVSADKSEKALMNYYRDAHGKWLYLPYGCDEINTLWNRYNIRTMPTLIILRPGGDVITRDAVAHVKRRTPQETLQQWKNGEIDEKKSKCSFM
uniref:Thioredoxin domain-containing protein n=1 Tax=Ascaris lumbricoides TaxID=6252 RepID=A0A9J2PF57_ASCLU